MTKHVYSDATLGDPVDIIRDRLDAPDESPIQPHQLDPDSELRFDCHPGVACFNACCRNIDIQITPYDIIRLKQRFGMTSSELVAGYTLPFEMDCHGLPGLRLRTKPGTAECAFLGEDGCTVYEDRPVACRYYALGAMGVRRKEASRVEDVYFVVKEPHCRGHDEPRTRTVGRYRADQGIEEYDANNAEWRDVIIKKRSSGPSVGRPSERSMQLFDMCSYDMDSFREFVRSPGFQGMFDLDEATMQEVLNDEKALLAFAMRFLKQTLFGETTIPLKAGARERRLAARRERIQQKRAEEVARHKAHDPRDEAGPED